MSVTSMNIMPASCAAETSTLQSISVRFDVGRKVRPLRVLVCVWQRFHPNWVARSRRQISFYACLHTDAENIIYFDTDTLLMFDKTWKQLVDDVDKPK